MFIDRRGGTGVGIFRYMYARFLGEAASITGEPRLADMGQTWPRSATAGKRSPLPSP